MLINASPGDSFNSPFPSSQTLWKLIFYLSLANDVCHDEAIREESGNRSRPFGVALGTINLTSFFSRYDR